MNLHSTPGFSLGFSVQGACQVRLFLPPISPPYPHNRTATSQTRPYLSKQDISGGLQWISSDPVFSAPGILRIPFPQAAHRIAAQHNFRR